MSNKKTVEQKREELEDIFVNIKNVKGELHMKYVLALTFLYKMNVRFTSLLHSLTKEEQLLKSIDDSLTMDMLILQDLVLDTESTFSQKELDEIRKEAYSICKKTFTE